MRRGKIATEQFSAPNKQLQGMRGRQCFLPDDMLLRGGPAPLILVSLGRWASIVAAAGASAYVCASTLVRPHIECLPHL
jgi:hypothetical protein